MNMFVANSSSKYTSQKKYLILAVLKGPDEYLCKACGVSEWEGKQLVLQLHHKDSNRQNAELTNLELLCPNCHAATDSWGGAPIDNLA